VFQDHKKWNAVHPGTAFGLDIPQIDAQLKRMQLPGQEIVLVSGLHNLHEHKHVYMALVKSLRYDSSHELTPEGEFIVRRVEKSYSSLLRIDPCLDVLQVPYLDTAVLRQELEDAADPLAAELIESNAGVKREYFVEIASV
jgi:hypothetical protein